MVCHKKTQSFKDSHGNLPQSRGAGKGGKSRGRGHGKVGRGEGKVPPAETAEKGRVAEMDEEASERPEGGTGVEIPGMIEVGTRDSEGKKEKGATGAKGLMTRNMQKFIDQMNEDQEKENPLEGASSG